ncbi:hypothetical protein FNF27_07737 [Cafeteria roenbergensis]|uniref:Deacetylase sirtuin-type domain-containing protein n=2 Tax=Cafeteria roenbergensis TaxID=33653 RepID=A0A5A8DHS7_CAFRO|nr:hypothetical protein FNF27_07737 [Cafeteria roenbergensis]
MEQPAQCAAGGLCDAPAVKSVAAIDRAALRRNLADFVCFSCGDVVDSDSESEVVHWLSRGGSAAHSLVMNVTSFTIRNLLAKRSVPNAEAVAIPALRDALEHLHTARYGNLDWLYPERRAARDQRLRDAHLSARRATQSFELRWQAFKDRFDSSMSALVGSIAASLAAEGAAAWTEPSAEEKAEVFGGRPPTVLAIAKGIQERRFRRIVAIIGAGVSTSAGIPDFRSPGGIYELARSGRAAALPDPLGGSGDGGGAEGAASGAGGDGETTAARRAAPCAAGRPEKLFDLAEYKRNPSYFAAMAGTLVPHHLRAGGPASSGGARPTAGHAFLRLLSDRGQLLRCYTQNVDDLERAAGLPPGSVVQAHGSFASASCVAEGCGATAAASDVNAALVQGEVPRCGTCGGLAKPDIVFFGESLAPSYAAVRRQDMEAADLVIVMGTSLRVQPVASQPRDAGALVPRLLINRELVGLDDRAETGDDVEATGAAAPAGNRSVRARASGLRCDGSEGAGMPSCAPTESDPAAGSPSARPAARAQSPVALDASEAAGATSTATAAGSDTDRANYRDAALLGDIDVGVCRIAAAMGLSAELAALVEELQREG